MEEFNAKSKDWYSQDKTSFQGRTIESITSQFGLYKLKNEPTNLLESCSLWLNRPNIYIAAKFGS